MSYCLLEFAKNLRLQKKVQDEIDGVLKKAGIGNLTYEMLNEMKFLECCIDETLRKYPSAPVLFRECTKDYKIDNLVIPKGSSIFIPVLGFQRDPKIFDNPLEFRPERFLNSSNGGGNSDGCFYMPFGDGPRNCIGTRLGKLTVKLGLVTVLSKFSVRLEDNEMANKELEFSPSSFILAPLKDYNLKIESRAAN